MKRILSLSLFFVILGYAVISVAGDGNKIGYVDLQEALNSSEAGKTARDLFKTEVERMQKDLDKRQEELKKMKDELEKQSFLLSEDTRERKEKEYQEKLKNFQRFYQDSQEQLQSKDNQLTKKILLGLQAVIAAMGQEEGYAVILEKTESNILYAPSSIDLTSAVVKRYNGMRK